LSDLKRTLVVSEGTTKNEEPVKAFVRRERARLQTAGEWAAGQWVGQHSPGKAPAKKQRQRKTAIAKNRDGERATIRAPWGDESSPEGSLNLILVVEQEFLGVDQRPYDVFVGTLGILGILFDVSRGDGRFVRGRFAGERQQIQVTNLDGGQFASQHARELPAVNLPWISPELSKWRLWAKFASEDRSHSQALLDSGRPKTVRKYELKPLSGSCVARVPTGIAPKLVVVPVT